MWITPFFAGTRLFLNIFSFLVFRINFFYKSFLTDMTLFVAWTRTMQRSFTDETISVQTDFRPFFFSANSKKSFVIILKYFPFFFFSFLPSPPLPLSTLFFLTIHFPSFFFSLFLHFSSSFKMNYFLYLPGRCGGSLSEEVGTIKSPNYPNQYPSDSFCVWTIKAPSGYQIMIYSTTFALEGSNCE